MTGLVLEDEKSMKNPGALSLLRYRTSPDHSNEEILMEKCFPSFQDGIGCNGASK